MSGLSRYKFRCSVGSCSNSKRHPSAQAAQVDSDAVELRLGKLGPCQKLGLCASVNNFQVPQIKASGPSGITSLGDFSPSVSMGHTSSESMGGSAADAARRSRGSRPTRRQRVAYQSAMCRRPSLQLPRSLPGMKPPETKAATLMPPSKLLYLPPRKGQLLAAFSARRTGPPLSDEKIIKVLFHMPFFCNALVRFPTTSSMIMIMAACCLRHLYFKSR
mmetsp:Transcript_45579/g.99284  ORF Transcript_45579/g.99284 Transcript_45579/m.99284 type:complete len:218 (+) Transcript_45579:205-858(+)